MSKIEPTEFQQGARVLRPQFKLRTLLLLVTLACLVLAAAKLLSPLAIAVLVVLLLSVMAHVVGNALGTRLRDGDEATLGPFLDDDLPPLHDDSRSSGDMDEAMKRGQRRPVAERWRAVKAEDFARQSQLSHRESLPWGLILPCVLGGVVLGGLVGGWWLAHILGAKLTLGKLAVGSTAAALLGGLLGFLLSAFLKTLVNANVDAWRS